MGCSNSNTKEENNTQNKPIQTTGNTKNERIENSSYQVTQTTSTKHQVNQKINQGNKYRIDIKSTLNKEKCNTLLSQLPKRESTNLTSFKQTIKNLTSNLTPSEKAYILFLWIGQNVDYDAQGYFAGTDVDVTPEGVFNNGKTVCSGYSRLYRDIGIYIDLIIENVSCYAKGVGYKPGDKFYSTNHEYNVIKLNDIWYPIDSTWGAGHIKDRQYVRESNEFYFCCDPELLIRTHFPSDEKWMLTENKYSLDDFSNWPHIYSYFYRLGFYKCFPDEAMIDIKSRGDNNFQKFIFWNNNMKNINASCNVYLLTNNTYYQQLKLNFIFYYDDRLEVHCIFNKKGKYKITIYGNNKEKEQYEGLIDYIVNVENDAQKELFYPYTYSLVREIFLIEPLYDILRHGQKVKFKLKSDVDSIIIIDNNKWIYLEKNYQGFFEKEITIQTEPGYNVFIGKKTENNSCSYLLYYQVV